LNYSNSLTTWTLLETAENGLQHLLAITHRPLAPSLPRRHQARPKQQVLVSYGALDTIQRIPKPR